MKRILLTVVLAACTPACGGDVPAPQDCEPATQRACNTPDDTTLNKGVCRAGIQTCGADGTYGPCQGEVLPTEEVCDLDGHDENCDGTVNEACACAPGTVEDCYDGGAIPEPKGICHVGTRVCGPDGVFGDCVGAQMPETEDCNGDFLDEDCDGKVNEGCLCIPGSTTACYEEPEGTPGPVGTEGVGLCKSGVRTCNVQGTEYGGCEGAVLPASEECDLDGLDEDCDGQMNESGEDCVCVPDTESACDYTGPVGTEGVGLCVAGKQTCDGLGLALGEMCSGEVVPACENCTVPNASNDENCDGMGACSSNVGWAANYKAVGSRDAFYAIAKSRDTQGNLDGGLVLGGDTGGSYNWNGKTIAGNYTSSIVVKLNANRDVVWATDLGAGPSSVQVVESVAVDSHGDLVVAGRFTETMTPKNAANVPVATLVGPAGTTNYDLFLVKLDGTTGDAVWAKQLNTSFAAYAPRVSVSATDELWLAGTFVNSLDFDAAVSNGPCVSPAANGGYLCATGGQDMFVAKFDGSGLWKCASSVGGAADDKVRDMVLDDGGIPIVVGSYVAGVGTVTVNPGAASPIVLEGDSGDDIFVGVVDESTCAFSAARGFASSVNNNNSGDEAVYAVDYYAATSTIVVGGTYDGNQLDLGTVATLPASKGGSDIFFAGLDRTTLSTKWQKSYGSGQTDNLVDLSLGCGGEITAVGVAYATSLLVPKVAYGQTPFVAKLDATGSILWSDSQATDAAAPNPDIIKLFAVTTMPLGSAVVVGEMQGNFAMGGAFLSTSYYSDMFVFEIGP